MLWLCDHVTNWNYSTFFAIIPVVSKLGRMVTYIYTVTMSITIKLAKVLTYHEELPVIKSHSPLIKWSCKITWQTKTIRSPLPQCQWLTKLSRMVTHQDGLSPIKSHDPLIVSSKSRDILNPFYLHYTIPLDTKPGRMGTYCKRLLPLKSHDALITWPNWGHMTFRKIYISIFTILVITKLDMVLTSCQASARQRLIHHRLFIFFGV